MYKAMFAAVVAAGLIAAPQPLRAQTAVPATTTAKTDAKTKTPSAGVLTARECQKKCGAKWKEAKAAGKTEKGMKWPQYWSA